MDQSLASAPLFDYLFVNRRLVCFVWIDKNPEPCKNQSKGKEKLKRTREFKMAKYQLLLIDEEDSIVMPVIVNEICRYDAT